VNAERCPHCDADLRGEPIPEDQRELFGGHTHGLRGIVQVDPDLGRAVAYYCPDCGENMWEKPRP
jgi:hypothetical protein